MEKKLVLPAMAGVLLAAVVMTGCASMIASMTKVWDETLPESEMAYVVFSLAGKATSYNGVALEKEYYLMKIPAGNADFIINMAVSHFESGWGGGNVIYNAEGMEFEFSFEAGKEYCIVARASGGEGDNWRKGDDWVWGVEIYDEIPAVNYPSKEHLLGFAPFKNQPAGWD
jgi:hypothetical protein